MGNRERKTVAQNEMNATKRIGPYLLLAVLLSHWHHTALLYVFIISVSLLFTFSSSDLFIGSGLSMVDRQYLPSPVVPGPHLLPAVTKDNH